jgi:UDP-galactopyranose mutase
MFDYLIVGAGFAGSILAERLASQSDKKILIVDTRNHIAGNAMTTTTKTAFWCTSMVPIFSHQFARCV